MLVLDFPCTHDGQSSRLVYYYNWLADMGLEIGRDWHWCWHHNSLAVEFSSPVLESMARLKLPEHT